MEECTVSTVGRPKIRVVCEGMWCELILIQIQILWTRAMDGLFRATGIIHRRVQKKKKSSSSVIASHLLEILMKSISTNCMQFQVHKSTYLYMYYCIPMQSSRIRSGKRPSSYIFVGTRKRHWGVPAGCRKAKNLDTAGQKRFGQVAHTN